MDLGVLSQFKVSIGLLILMCIYLFRLRLHLSRAQMLLDVADAAEAGVIVFGASGLFEYANQKAKESIANLTNKNYSKLTLKDFLAHLYDHAQDYSENEQISLAQSNEETATGGFHEFVSFDDHRVFYVKMKKLKNNKIVFLINDISDKKRKIDRISHLWENNQQLLYAIEASTCGILVSDPKRSDNPIVFINDTLCAFLNIAGTSVLGGGWDVVLSQISEASAREKLDMALIRHEDIETELSFERDGKVLWFSLKLAAVHDDVGDLDFFVCVFTDISLLKQREAEFFQMQKLEALGQLAAGMAHDFNNILSIVDGYSLMAEKIVQAEPAKAADYMKKISDNARRGSALTQKMLTFSRHKVVSKNVINLSQVLEDNKTFLVPFLDAGIHFELSRPKEEIRVKATADAIGQVLMNLCINARDAMPNGGSLIVQLRDLPRSGVPDGIREKIASETIACLSVSDTGSGIDKKTMERIFDPFFTTKAQGKGTGLGLSVVYGLIQEMGGAIDVRSSVGRGTTVFVYLPIVEDAVSKSVRSDLENGDSISLNGYTALLAEDEPDLRYAITAILEGFGLKVLAASCGDEALVIQDQYEEDIDILLTDVVMPGMNGVKLAELLTALRPETRVVFMSGYPANGEMAPVSLPQDAIFIAKPINYTNTADIIKRVIKRENLIKIKENATINEQLWT